MSTTVSSRTGEFEKTPANQPAPKKILKDAYKTVLAEVNTNKKLILVTGGTKKGKTALLHTICKDIAQTHRIVSLAGKDLPSSSKSNESSPAINDIKAFIIESTDLNDKLIVAIDDADCLPISFLSDLAKQANNPKLSDCGLQLILTGPPKLKGQLHSLKHISNENLSYCTIDGLSEKEILDYAKTKTYKISSNIKNLKFKSESLREISDFVQLDKRILDVILEWCAAITKKDQLSFISSETVHRAINFAKQFSKDKNLRLENSYPPAHEVYKYINKEALPSKSSNKKPKVKINVAEEILIKTPEKTDTKATKIPTITAAKTTQPKKPSAPQSSTETLETLYDIEKEIMPPQWVPANKSSTENKKPFPTLVGLLSVLILSFVIFITYRISSDPTISETSSNQIAINNNQEDVHTDNSAETVLLEESIEIETKNVNAEAKPHVDIVVSDTNSKPNIETAINKPIVAPLILGDLDESLISEIESSKKTQSVETNDPINESSSEISDLLALAEHQFNNKKLTTPAKDNALETYQQILSIQPENEAASNGIQKVHDKYLNWANYYFKQNDLNRAKQFYTKALAIDPSNDVARTNLQNITRQEILSKNSVASSSATETVQDETRNQAIQNLLLTAEEKMLQIEKDISANSRNYRVYQEAQTTYQNVLRSYPQNSQARQGLSSLANYYVDWAEQQVQSKNYNIALFLYGQALSIQPGNDLIERRITQIRELKQSP